MNIKAYKMDGVCNDFVSIDQRLKNIEFSREQIIKICEKHNTKLQIDHFRRFIPVYKKLADLENLTLVRVEKTILSEKGRHFKVYRSRINKAEISIKKPEPTLSLSAN